MQCNAFFKIPALVSLSRQIGEHDDDDNALFPRPPLLLLFTGNVIVDMLACSQISVAIFQKRKEEQWEENKST